MLAILRLDLRDQKDSVSIRPLNSPQEIVIENENEKFECMQPDCWDSQEWNLLLVDSQGNMFMGRSCEFDFFETDVGADFAIQKYDYKPQTKIFNVVVAKSVVTEQLQECQLGKDGEYIKEFNPGLPYNITSNKILSIQFEER